MRLFYWSLGLAMFLFHSLNYATPPDALPDPILTSVPLTSSLIASLTLEQAIQQAYQFNPELIAKRRDIGIAEAGMKQARVSPNPELAALTEGLEKGRRVTTVQMNQVIELGGKRSSRINVAERDREIAFADVVIQQSKVRADVIEHFLNVLNAQEHIQLAEASWQLAVQVSRVVQRRVTAGRASPIESTRSDVVELTIKNELSQAKMALAIAKSRLAAMWGEVTPKFIKAIKPDTVDANGVSAYFNGGKYDELSTLQSRLTFSPQLMRAQLEIERQQAQEQIERSRQIGDVTLSIGHKREEETERHQSVLGISIPIPLFDRNQGNVLGALRKIDKARDEFKAIALRLNSELTQAYQQYQLTKAELTVLQSEILPKAEQVIAATIKGFEFGKFNLLDVHEAQRTLFRTKLQYLQVQAALYQRIAEIERLVGSDKNQEIINEN